MGGVISFGWLFWGDKASSHAPSLPVCILLPQPTRLFWWCAGGVFVLIGGGSLGRLGHMQLPGLVQSRMWGLWWPNSGACCGVAWGRHQQQPPPLGCITRSPANCAGEGLGPGNEALPPLYVVKSIRVNASAFPGALLLWPQGWAAPAPPRPHVAVLLVGCRRSCCSSSMDLHHRCYLHHRCFWGARACSLVLFVWCMARTGRMLIVRLLRERSFSPWVAVALAHTPTALLGSAVAARQQAPCGIACNKQAPLKMVRRGSIWHSGSGLQRQPSTLSPTKQPRAPSP